MKIYVPLFFIISFDLLASSPYFLIKIYRLDLVCHYFLTRICGFISQRERSSTTLVMKTLLFGKSQIFHMQIGDRLVQGRAPYNIIRQRYCRTFFLLNFELNDFFIPRCIIISKLLQEVKRNGSLYAHIFFARSGFSPDPNDPEYQPLYAFGRSHRKSTRDFHGLVLLDVASHVLKTTTYL